MQICEVRKKLKSSRAPNFDDSTVGEGKRRLNPSRDKNEGSIVGGRCGKKKRDMCYRGVLVVQKNTLQRALHVNRRKVVVHRLTLIGGTVAKINVAKPHNTHKVYTSVTRKKWQTCDKRETLDPVHTHIHRCLKREPAWCPSIVIRCHCEGRF